MILVRVLINFILHCSLGYPRRHRPHRLQLAGEPKGGGPLQDDLHPHPRPRHGRPHCQCLHGRAGSHLHWQIQVEYGRWTDEHSYLFGNYIIYLISGNLWRLPCWRLNIVTGCSSNFVFFLKLLWFFWTLPVLLRCWKLTCHCVNTLTESGIYFKIFEKTQYLMSTLNMISRKKHKT